MDSFWEFFWLMLTTFFLVAYLMARAWSNGRSLT